MSSVILLESHVPCLVSRRFLLCPCYSWEHVTVNSAWRLEFIVSWYSFRVLLRSARVFLIPWYFWYDQAGATFYKKTGLGPLPQALFNGVPFNREEMDAAELETVILQRIIDATGFFQRAAFMVCLTFPDEGKMKYLAADSLSHVYILIFL